MSRETQKPTLDERGDETHPAFGLIGASRVSNSPPGATLFDSDIRHAHTVIVRIKAATRKRDLNRDWIHGRREFVEVEMSEAQWASFVSSMNSGDGVPCTIRRNGEQLIVPDLPYDPRLAHSIDEVRSAAHRAVAEIGEAFEAYKAHKTAANLRALRIAIDHVEPNTTYAAQSLTQHAENVVQKARADIEAFVVNKAQQIGLDPATVSSPLELSGTTVDVDDDDPQDVS